MNQKLDSLSFAMKYAIIIFDTELEVLSDAIDISLTCKNYKEKVLKIRKDN